ncbi:hypothetical protein C4D60_Mb03t12760 [Musa balbisiana]|uniref:Transmembrane 9 superfamily member n=1 Tax=Musa balbisiana TaxID=52838 RepID=A0A4S8J9K3_MUSBA|nr:hypothetical protein C4D60_Mb03t12760 [Musa balbisiana]
MDGESLFVLLNLHHQRVWFSTKREAKRSVGPSRSWRHMPHACIPSSSDMLAEARVHPAVGSFRASVITTWQCAGLCLLLVDLSARVKKRSTHMDEARSVCGLFIDRYSIFNTRSRLLLSIKQRGTVGSYSPTLGLYRFVCWVFYNMFNGTEWKKIITSRTAFTFPGIVSAIFFVLNAHFWGERSSGVTTIYVGFKKPAIEDPAKPNKIPRQIPEQAWYMNRPIFSILNGGILPFGAVFIELFFILTSIWLNQFYHFFGFLFLVFYHSHYHLEDYLWWWRSYLTSESSALHLFLYATFYFFTNLEITKQASGILYLGYILIASLC